jgi:hypothetical protein
MDLCHILKKYHAHIKCDRDIPSFSHTYIYIYLYIYEIKKYKRNTGCLNGLPEMLITTDGLATSEAEALTTVAAHHLVAPFGFGNDHPAFRA